MSPIRALIVDDEPLAREGIRLHLAGAPDVEIVGECGDGEAAVAAIRDLAPDLLFLDIHLPGLDGFEVLDRIAGPAPAVVFVTAHDQHAVAAFERHALDYLLKPFDPARFARTMARVRAEHSRRRPEDLAQVLAVLKELREKPSHLERVAVHTAGRYVFLSLDEVDWIEAAGNYVRLHVGERGHLLRETLSGFETKIGDGTTATGASPVHTCAVSGGYSITLTVTDNQGYSSGFEDYHYVHPDCGGLGTCWQ